MSRRTRGGLGTGMSKLICEYAKSLDSSTTLARRTSLSAASVSLVPALGLHSAVCNAVALAYDFNRYAGAVESIVSTLPARPHSSRTNRDTFNCYLYADIAESGFGNNREPHMKSAYCAVVGHSAKYGDITVRMLEFNAYSSIT